MLWHATESGAPIGYARMSSNGESLPLPKTALTIAAEGAAPYGTEKLDDTVAGGPAYGAPGDGQLDLAGHCAAGRPARPHAPSLAVHAVSGDPRTAARARRGDPYTQQRFHLYLRSGGRRAFA